MDTVNREEVQAQNIISLFGGPIDVEMDIEDLEVEESSIYETMLMQEDIFSVKIQDPQVSLEAGFVILGDQIKELRKRISRTSYYLTDLENLLT